MNSDLRTEPMGRFRTGTVMTIVVILLLLLFQLISSVVKADKARTAHIQAVKENCPDRTADGCLLMVIDPETCQIYPQHRRQTNDG